MDIKLYYIEGISRADTPYFSSKGVQATLARQKDYFDDHVVTTISTAFYPPHYTNVVKVDIEDVTFTDTVNYLSLEYNDKTYYYFIDDIEYVSESIIRLYITMDVIQTYMFNIRITNGVIERKFINRWNNDNTINRNYLRENLSNGLIRAYTTYQELNANSNYYIIAKGEDRLFPNLSRGTYQQINLFNLKFNMSCDRIFAAPLLESATLIWGAASTSSALNPSALVRSAASDAYIHDIFIIPFNPFNEITENGSTLTASDPIYFYNDNKYPISTFAFSTRNADNTVVKSKLYSTTVSFSFDRNTSLEVPFSATYCPVMLDENYIRLEFGSKNNNTTYPLYFLSDISVYCKYFADILTGARYYYIASSNSDYIDMYKTMAVDGSAIGLEMFNDAWEKYVATNRARWIGPVAQAGKNVLELIATQGLSGGAKIGAVGKDINKAENIQYANLLRNKKGQFTRGLRRIGSTKAVTSRTVFGEIPTNDDNTLEGIKSGLSTSLPITMQTAEDSNYYYAPNAVTQTGNFGDVYSRACIIYYGISYVNDFEQCAQYYHRNGYLINEYVNAIDNIFEYVQNRFYFNVLKMSIPEVHLVGVVEDSTTISSIVDRLEAGIRLWNVLPTTFTRTAQYHYNHTSTGQRQLLQLTYWDFEIPANDTLKGKTVTNVTANTTPVATSVHNYNFNSNTGALSYSTRAAGTFLETTLTSDVYVTYEYIETINPVNLGNFMYDNVELKYIN